MIRLVSFLLLLTVLRCDKQDTGTCIKGKLAIKGICKNYVIQDVDGILGVDLTEANWKDPSTGVEYKNAFALGSPCSFPESIMEGEEFWFTVDTSGGGADCGVCLAYRPVPGKAIKIRVCSKSN